jgi:hypothetical protein
VVQVDANIRYTDFASYLMFFACDAYLSDVLGDYTQALRGIKQNGNSLAASHLNLSVQPPHRAQRHHWLEVDWTYHNLE